MSVVALMAGGTGGHLFPAMALAQELRRRGHEIELFTDHRVGNYGDVFPAREIHVIPSATPAGRNPLTLVGAGGRIAWGIAVAGTRLRRVKPDLAVGFGGYPTFPPFLAARALGIPGILHEQNALLGRANRALGRYASAIALSYPQTARAEAFAKISQVTGNPVRDRVRAIADTPYPSLGEGDKLRLVVTGGSQGARVFSDLVPPAIGLLSSDLRARLVVVQQCRPEDLDRVAEAYRQSKVNVELAAFFPDLPERMAGAHLVICRSGASTVAELTVIGRPAILVPLPGSIEGDQAANAKVLEAAGGGWIAEQATLSPLSLATRLATLLESVHDLRRAAEAARALGQPEAVAKLADMCESLARKGSGDDRT